MIGRWRWSSIAFLRYIEKQVLDFSKGVSKDMIKNNMFFNVPSQPWTDVRNKEFASSSQHHSQQAYRQIFGPSGSSLRDQQLFETSHLKFCPSPTNPKFSAAIHPAAHFWPGILEFCTLLPDFWRRTYESRFQPYPLDAERGLRQFLLKNCYRPLSSSVTTRLSL